MPRISITAEAHAKLRGAAELPFRETATRESNGNYSVPLSIETYERVTAQMFPGESYSDTLIRIISGKAN